MGRRIEPGCLTGIYPDTDVAIAERVPWPVCNHCIKSGRVNPTERIVKNISVQVRIASGEADRILGDEALVGGGVVPGPVVVQPRAVVLASGVLVGIGIRLPRGGTGPKGLVSVCGLHGAGIVGQSQGGAERIAQECAGARTAAASEVLVDAEAGEQVGEDVAGSVQLL